MKQDMTKGPLGRQILFFSVPLIISNLLQVLFNMADVAVVGRFAGSIALGAVGSTTTLVGLYTGFLIGIGNGINVIAARHLGAKNKKEVVETVHTSAILSLIIGIFVAVIGICLSTGILKILNTKPELMDGAVLYLNIYFLGMPAMAVYNFGNAVYSAVGNTKKPLVFLSIAGIINIILNLFFVIVCRMDVAGVAIASVISQYISAFMIVAALFRSKDIYRLSRSELRLNRNKVKAVLGVGIPAGMQNVIFQTANLFIQTGVNSFDATMVAGNSAASNADNLIYNVMMAFYTACSSFIGQNYGAGNKERVKKSFIISLAYSFGVGLILGLLAVAFGPSFLALFTKDPAVVEAGMKRLGIMGFSYCLSALMDCAIAASRGLGKSVQPMIIIILGSCVFRIIWVYTIFAYFGTIASLYLLYAFSWTITAAAEIIYFMKIYRGIGLLFSDSKEQLKK